MWSTIYGKYVTILQNKNMNKLNNSLNLKFKNSRAYPDEDLESKRKKAIMYLKKRGIYIKDFINHINGDKHGKNQRNGNKPTNRKPRAK